MNLWLSEHDKPGCFGYSTTYTEGHAACEACPFGAECKTEASEMARRLREELGVDAILKRRRQQAPSATSTPAAKVTIPVTPKPAAPKTKTVSEGFNSGNKKADDALATWERKNLAVRERIARNENPFVTPAWAKVAVDHLLEKRSASKSELRELFQSKLGWRDGAASSHVSILSAAFGALGIADVSSNKIELK